MSAVVSLLSLGLTYGYIRALGYDTMGEAFFISLLVPLPMTLITGWAIFSLIVALEQARHVAHVQSITDSLTGLANRRHFVQTAQRAVDLALRHRLPLALLILDIDHFKRVNDTHGHDAGDKVLVEVARRCAQYLRTTDLLARWGGEEFVVLLPNTPLEHARQLAERMREAVAFSAQLYAPSDAVRVTISVGAAGMAEGEPMTLDALVQAADHALYDAKRAGRNQVSLATGHGGHSGLSRFGSLLAT
ncbi:GGDEF domain-containing protein [Rhodoferax sp.]|uniref:GGDEF domain-containing protein n=1 Tax=Rhodoferax sp. TaxID=50421 RepID=UPI0025E2288C|nr:GGDEF domain-containing protein [Rhodoferax sp.]